MKAFVSYRRNDSFRQNQDGTINNHLLENLETALRSIGFDDVFIDTRAIVPGDHFEGRIYRAISQCDLFIVLIGEKWEEILIERGRWQRRDIVAREIRAALRLDKEIIPLFIDANAIRMPEALPREIAAIQHISGQSIKKTASPEEIATILKTPAENLSQMRKLGKRWITAYLSISVLFYFLCCIAPHLSGLNEFGVDAWKGMTLAWGGLFVWPIFFLPFILLALFRPITIMLEAALNSSSWADALTYVSPLIVGTILSFIGIAVEISPPEAPWTVHPTLSESCKSSYLGTESSLALASDYNRHKLVLSSYITNLILGEAQQGKFAGRDACWPDVFFYVTQSSVSLRQESENLDRHKEIMNSFRAILGVGEKSQAPYSRTFPYYVIAFSILLWLCALAILLSIIYSFIAIKRLGDDKVLTVPNEDVMLCLMYAFVTWLIWIPFRIHTNHIKIIYSCISSESCDAILRRFYVRDFGLGAMLTLAFIFLTLALLWKHKRILLGLIGACSVALISGATYVFVQNPSILMAWAELWEFWAVLSIFFGSLALALWFQFSPAIVRFNDFRRDIESDGNQGK